MSIEILEKLWKRGTDFLGVQYAIIGGAMSWISERHLVSAISNAGGFGVIACGSMTPSLLDAEIKATFLMTNNNFGINLITMHPELDNLINVCINNKVSHIILAGGLPKQSYIEKIKNSGIKIICFAPSLIIGKRLIKIGVDALIIEGMEAGGHIGHVSTSVLAQEILPEIKDVPIFVAGGIGRGEVMASYLKMGASAVQLGTRFVCAHESIAHNNFKEIFIKANSRDAIASIQIDEDFPVIAVRSIANKATKDFLDIQNESISLYKRNILSKEEAQLKIEHFWSGALRAAVIDGDIERGSLMAGQTVGMVKRCQSTKEIIMELIEQAQNFL